ncbi:MAG: glycosyltransferase [Candidatus Magasanikbacteria bacterium]|nr:glycosyltransferase [Candidatus Magasanikbacteria bacterium]
MKLCLINNLFPPYSVGGAERVVERIAKEAVKNGGQAVVITWKPWTGWGPWHPVKMVEDGVAVYRFWVPNIFSYKNLTKHNFLFKLWWHKIDIWNFLSAWIIKKILEQEKPDEVQTHNLMGIGFSVPRVIQKLGIRHTHYLHDIQLVEPSGVLPWDHERDSLLQRIYSLVMKSKFGRPDAIISPSKFLVEFYKKRGFFVGSPHHLITSSPHHTIRNDERRVCAGGWTRFLFIGSLVKHKGARVLMRAWSLVDKNLPVELHIVGDGGLKKEVEEWARGDGRVRVYGRLGGGELEEVYKKCDVLIFPSICVENHPAVIDEAHRFGLKIIASDTGGVREMMREGDVLVRPGEFDVLSEKIYNYPII